MRAVINVYLKNGVLDSQGKAVHHSLNSLGFEQVSDVRIGRQIVLKLDSTDSESAQKEATQMCESLLANTVIEEYEIKIEA